MSHIKTLKTISAAFSLGLLFGSNYVHASGFELNEKSVAASAMANAGDVVNAETAAAIFFNPAAISQLTGTHATAGVSYVDVEATFEGNARNYSGQTVDGSNGGDFVDSVVIPNLAVTHELNDVVTLGFGLSAPYGVRSEYADDFVGRNFALLTDLKVIDAQATAAFTGDNGLSLGVSVHAMKAEGELTKSQDFSQFGTPDGFLKAEGDDTQLAYSFGLYYPVSDKTRLGATFKTGAKFDMEGDASLTNVPNPLTGELVTLTEAAKIPIQTPDTMTFGIGHKVTHDVELFVSAKWSKWSDFEAIDLISTADNAGAPGTLSAIGSNKYGGENTIAHISANWKDTWSYALGMRWQATDSFALKAGYAFDESPVNPQYRTARLPGTDREWLTLGAQWRAPHDVLVDVAVGYLLIDDPAINEVERNVNDEPLNNPANVEGNYELDAWGTGIQISKAF